MKFMAFIGANPIILMWDKKANFQYYWFDYEYIKRKKKYN